MIETVHYKKCSGKFEADDAMLSKGNTICPICGEQTGFYIPPRPKFTNPPDPKPEPAPTIQVIVEQKPAEKYSEIRAKAENLNSLSRIFLIIGAFLCLLGLMAYGTDEIGTSETLFGIGGSLFTAAAVTWFMAQITHIRANTHRE